MYYMCYSYSIEMHSKPVESRKEYYLSSFNPVFGKLTSLRNLFQTHLLRIYRTSDLWSGLEETA